MYRGRRPPSTSEDVKQRGTDLITKLATDDYVGAEAYFDNQMKDALPPDKLRDTWQSLAAQFGQFKTHDAAYMDKATPQTSVIVPCVFENGRLDAKTVFDASGKVSGLWFAPAADPGGSSAAPGWGSSPAGPPRRGSGRRSARLRWRG
jgi:hypothetical protein